MCLDELGHLLIFGKNSLCSQVLVVAVIVQPIHMFFWFLNSKIQRNSPELESAHVQPIMFDMDKFGGENVFISPIIETLFEYRGSNKPRISNE